MDYKEQITSRLILILDRLYSGNKSRMGDVVGVDESRIRSYTQKNVVKRSMPPAEFIAALIEKVEINPEWLLLGVGEMIKEKGDVKAINEVSEPAGVYGVSKMILNYEDFKNMTDLAISQQGVISQQAKLIDDLSRRLMDEDRDGI